MTLITVYNMSMAMQIFKEVSTMGFFESFLDFAKSASERAKRNQEENFIRQCREEARQWENWERKINREYDAWERDFNKRYK